MGESVVKIVVKSGKNRLNWVVEKVRLVFQTCLKSVKKTQKRKKRVPYPIMIKS